MYEKCSTILGFQPPPPKETEGFSYFLLVLKNDIIIIIIISRFVFTSYHCLRKPPWSSSKKCSLATIQPAHRKCCISNYFGSVVKYSLVSFFFTIQYQDSYIPVTFPPPPIM